jgi:formylglycine-generating enzyme required for sulfatase activity
MAADLAPATESLISIRAGSFDMGSASDDPQRFGHESLHSVTLTRSFHLGSTEVPWSLWNSVRDWALRNGYETLSTGNNGFRGKAGEDHPVVFVSWWDAVQWCNARSEMESLQPVYYTRADFDLQSVVRQQRSAIYARWKATGYRLPSEAEWEYAYRVGTPIQNIGSQSAAEFTEQGWNAKNSATNTHAVATKPANRLGVYDMPGNVWEWCWDWDAEYLQRATRDPTGPAEGILKAMRGGSWTSPIHNLRPAHRHAYPPHQRFYNIGFRIARTNSD